MIAIYCKAEKTVRKKLGKKWKVCEFLTDGFLTYHYVRYMEDLPVTCYKVTSEEFEKTYVNTLLALNGFEPIYPSISLTIKDFVEEETPEGYEEFNNLTELQKLNYALSKAEETSNYELAAILRDKIKNHKDGGK
tara:strand:+ start:21684 stop:22088 length:405 start_codon:yes stop_codon:yes gene_type:complete